MENFAFPARKSAKSRLKRDPDERGLEIYSHDKLPAYDEVIPVDRVIFEDGKMFHYYVPDNCTSIDSLLESSRIDEYVGRNLISYLKHESSPVPHQRPLVMAVANATPDSFYGGSRVDDGKRLLDDLIDASPDIIDVGGESTRPGSIPPGIDEEIQRVEPVIKYIQSVCDIPVSLDTRHPEVLLKFADRVDYANDVTGFRNSGMVTISAEYSLKCITMHMRGEPHNMQSLTNYTDVVPEVISYLGESASRLNMAGVGRDNIIIDPGLGFSKDFMGNMELIREVRSFSFGYGTLIGASRKSFIGKITGEQTEGRLPGTLAMTAYFALNGVDVIRVHDPKENLQVLKVIQSIVQLDD